MDKKKVKLNAAAKGGQHVNEPVVGPMARLKQENRDLKAENAELKRYIDHRWSGTIESTLDKRIETLRGWVWLRNTKPLKEAIAIIDVIRKENLRLRDATLAKFNEQAARIAKLEAEIARLTTLGNDFIQALKDESDIHDWSQCLTFAQIEKRKKQSNSRSEAPCLFATFEEEFTR